MTLQTITYWVIGGVVVLGVIVGGWFFFASPSQPTDNSLQNGFGTGNTRSVTVLPSDTVGDTTSFTPKNADKIFKVSDGPIVTAALVETLHPTTTMARFVNQQNGHVFDLVLDNSGMVPRTISNTTIPGLMRGVWAGDGSSVILQYLDNGIIKSVYLGLPPAQGLASSTKTLPVQLKFLPDGILDVGVSPDNKSLAYLLSSNTGSDGYIAKIDGSENKKLFSTPLSEVLISWPSQNNLLLQTKSGVGATGATFSVGAQSGTILPLVYAPGLTAIADNTFSRVIYQTRSTGISTYVHTVKTGTDKVFSFNPAPEKCIWSKTESSVLLCAGPLQYVSPSYLDLWHQGVSSAPDAIFAFDVSTGQSNIVAVPGGEGGTSSDIAEMAISPDDHYLLFIKKGDRSLWAVRLY